jgi:hypothetical protein
LGRRANQQAVADPSENGVRSNGMAYRSAWGRAAVVLLLVLGRPLHAQTAIFRGRIVDEHGERPIADAVIELRDLQRLVRSDSTGTFRLTGVPAGVHRVLVRRLGYDSVVTVMRFVERDSVDAEILLQATPTRLATVRTDAAGGPANAWKLQDFEERRAVGLGRFLDAATFERFRSRTVSEILVSSIPGLRTWGKGSQQYLEGQRGPRKGCMVQVILNGVSITNGETDELFDVNSLEAADIIGFEYYTVASTPPRFNTSGGKVGGSQCGTAVFWTK